MLQHINKYYSSHSSIFMNVRLPSKKNKNPYQNDKNNKVCPLHCYSRGFLLAVDCLLITANS